ncbi:MAG TPA: C4-type zinc ribbon domain-containing protein [Candidatus Dormibacteraeota bacterium]|nr:C4-type zinc ribbon domain-containing protein [Candidatus Dormibacteraeota bacterium]
MRPTETLLQFQRLGDRARTLGDEKTHLEGRLATDPRVDAAEGAKAAARRERDALVLDLKEMELEVEGHRAKMKGHERELMSGRIRSPTDLTRMSDEVGHMKTRLAEEEDRELELMTSLEAAEAGLAAATAELEAAEASRAAAAPGTRERLAAIEAELGTLEAQRAALWSEVPAPLQAAYNRISRIANAVVAEEGGQCMGCRVQLTTNELQQLRRGERFNCQNCNRILVLS